MSNPRVRLSRAERQEQTRETLLDTAERVFAAQGFQQTTLDELARAAGLTKGAVYSNFASKDELFLALLERRTAQDSARWREAFGAASGRERLDRIVRVAQGAMHSDPNWMTLELEFQLYARRSPAARAILARHYAAVNEAILTALRGHFTGKRDLETLASGLPALSLGLGMLGLLGNVGPETWDGMLQALLEPG